MPFALFSRAACAALLMLVSSNCDRPAVPVRHSGSPTADNTESLDLSSRSRLLATAERFETLTQAAFAADPDETFNRLSLARTDAEAVRPLLDPEGKRQFESLNAALSEAVASHSQVDLSIASNELYRLFMTEAHGERDIPRAIGLLEYAGFRYWADSRDRPVRWNDMAAAHSRAQYEWQAVRSRINDPRAADRFDRVLDALGEAVINKDAGSAAAAVQSQREQVDVFERAVSTGLIYISD